MTQSISSHVAVLRVFTDGPTDFESAVDTLVPRPPRVHYQDRASGAWLRLYAEAVRAAVLGELADDGRDEAGRTRWRLSMHGQRVVDSTRLVDRCQVCGRPLSGMEMAEQQVACGRCRGDGSGS